MYQDKPPLEEFLIHYGIDHVKGDPGSGRYRYGSGEHPFQHSGDFMSRVDQLRKSNPSFIDVDGKYGPAGKTYTGDTAVAHMLGLSSGQFRTQYSIAKDEQRSAQYARAKSLLDKGYGYSEVARKMGLPNESSVRSLMKESSKMRMEQARQTAELIKAAVDEKGMIDVGDGVERELGISKEKLKSAVTLLEMEGYVPLAGRIPNITDPTGNHKITLNVVAPPGTQKSDLYKYDVHTIDNYISKDGGETFEPKFVYPASMDSNRLMIRYAEDGGKDKDGVIELRRNVPDLDLRGSSYSQVRILVDNNRYLKGMAIYSDNMPPGVDVIFNTNKTKDVPKLDVLKKISNDPDNPFGSSIKDIEKGGQYWYTDKNGEKQLGLINKRADEGDWDDWKNKIPAQFLSKQPLSLANRQLNLAIEEKVAEYNDILNLTNDTVKKELLESFANDCDSAAVHLQAAALPRQRYQVILPAPTMKETEVYAPNYNNGEKVALVRYPHGGTFEIPILTVNNKVKDSTVIDIGKKVKDCVCINPKVAERLSGADFDGDTVMVLPYTIGTNKILSTPELPGLKGFDPKTEYGTKEVYNDKTKEYEYFNAAGKKVSIMKNTQTQMGEISNLITDMTLKNATNEELAAAVRHSMVVIDAEKHKLDYRTSYKVNEIDKLKNRYQLHIKESTGKESTSASTLISRSKGEVDVPKRQGTPKVNIKGTPQYDPNRPEGSLIFKNNEDRYYLAIKHPVTGKDVNVYEREKGKFYYNKSIDPKVKDYVLISDPSKIKQKERTQKSTQMAETDDARTLISEEDTPMENLYANFANKMKSMANQARKTAYETKDIQYRKDAAETYKKEVDNLKRSLDISRKNAPRERQAQVLAYTRVQAKLQSKGDMKKSEIKKIKQQEIERARQMVGASRKKIDISDREWEAIQAGAVSKTLLKQILKNTDLDVIREKATPINRKTVTDAMKVKIRSLSNSGKTNAEIANALGLSASTVAKYITAD